MYEEIIFKPAAKKTHKMQVQNKKRRKQIFFITILFSVLNKNAILRNLNKNRKGKLLQ